MGYEPKDCGKAGLVVVVGGKQPGKTILLRADMDALPMQEEADIDYRSETPGRMHGCGHDMHATMLLGAAKILKEHEDELKPLEEENRIHEDNGKSYIWGTFDLLKEFTEELIKCLLDLPYEEEEYKIISSV